MKKYIFLNPKIQNLSRRPVTHWEEQDTGGPWGVVMDEAAFLKRFSVKLAM